MMTWAQQVGHVFFKDVRTTRWFLLGYATLLVLGIVEVAAEQRNGMVPLGALLLRAVAVVICASVVLADAPFNQRAHWATLPYARSAVLAAKGVMIGALLIAAGVALMIALYAFEVPFGETVRPTGISLMGFLALLLATMLIASVERSFVAVVLVLVASVPVFFLFGSLVTTLFSVVPDMYAVAHSAMYASLAGVAVVVLLLSRARRVRTPLRLGVLYAAIVLVGVQIHHGRRLCRDGVHAHLECDRVSDVGPPRRGARRNRRNPCHGAASARYLAVAAGGLVRDRCWHRQLGGVG